MAETKKTKAKRRVKDPETFRQRAIKATAESEKPSKRHRVRGLFGRIFSIISKPFRPVAKALKRLDKYRFFRILGKIFGFIGKILVPTYVRNSWKELKLVTWPTWFESRRLTLAVLIFAAIFGFMIAGLDWVLNKLFREILIN